MAELTTEYLDKAFESFETKFEAKMDIKFANQTKELKTFTEEQVEKLATMVQTSLVEPFEQHFNEIGERFDQMDKNFVEVDRKFSIVELRLDRMDQKFEKLETALGVQL